MLNNQVSYKSILVTVHHYIRHLLHNTISLSPLQLFTATPHQYRDILPLSSSSGGINHDYNNKARRKNTSINILIFIVILITLLYVCVQLAPNLFHTSNNIKPSVNRYYNTGNPGGNIQVNE